MIKDTSKKTDLYTVSVKIMGKTTKAKGKTIAEAVGKLKVRNSAGMVIMTVSKGKVSKDRVISMMLAKRLFNMSGVSREAQIKNISSMFQGI